MAVVVSNEDPYFGFNFLVDFSRGETAAFMKIGEVAHNVGVAEQIEISDPYGPAKIPDRCSWGDVAFERGLTVNKDLIKWFDNVVKGLTDGSYDSIGGEFRRTVVIFPIRKAEDRASANPPTRIVLYEAWPIGYKVGGFDAAGSNVLLESLTLAHEGLARL